MRALLLIILAGCFSAHDTVCDDGTVCPASKVCAPAGGACVDPDMLHACDGKADGDRCDLAGGAGVCHGGLCSVAGFCGDGIVTPPEVCDDGNAVSGDGCRADCQKIEMCGDGILDQGEACDDGNTNPDDGCDACRTTDWQVSVLVGGTITGVESQLAQPNKIVLDGQRNMYILDTENGRVLRLDAQSQAVTVVAGNGDGVWSGDGGLAVDASFQRPTGMAIDGVGNLFIADSNRVRRVDALTGIISTIAGTGVMDQTGGEGDFGPATSAHVRAFDVVLDGIGNLYVSSGPASPGAQRVRKIALDGTITTYAGGAQTLQDNVPATQSSLFGPTGLAIDAQNQLYIADSTRIREVSAAGIITTIAGDGNYNYSGDGGPATSAELAQAQGVAVDGAGNVYIADNANDRVRRIDTGGTITTFAGTGAPGYTGDGLGPTAAAVGSPLSVATAAGDVFVAQGDGSVVRKVEAGTITTVAGTGVQGAGVTGEALGSTKIGNAIGVGVDASGRVYAGLPLHVVRFDPTGMTIVAGGGTSTANGIPATSAAIGLPSDIEFDSAGNMYIGDQSPCAVHEVDATTQLITTLASVCAESIALDGAGNVYASDPFGAVVRKIAPGGAVTIVAGSSTGYSGDGQLATVAQLNQPHGIALDSAGNLYIADRNNERIRRVDHTTGIITTFAGTGVAGHAGDGGPANLAQVYEPSDVEFGADGALYIAEESGGSVRKVDTTNTLTTVAGSHGAAFGGDLGPALQAGLGELEGLALDAAGDIFLVDQSTGPNNDGHVRRIDHTTGIVSTLAGQVLPAGLGPIANARLSDPGELVIAPSFMLVAGGRSGIVEEITPAAVDLAVGRYHQGIPTGDLARMQSDLFGAVRGIALDAAAGKLYVVDDHQIDVVTLVDPADVMTWTIAPFVGGAAGFADGASPLFDTPSGLWLDTTQHALYVADAGNHAVRAVDLTTGHATTVAGTPRHFGFAGDEGAATAAQLFRPAAVTRCGDRLYIADTGNNRVRYVSSDGNIHTVLGDGSRSSSGEGMPAATYPVDAPAGVACDALGNVFVTSSTTVRLLPADASGIVDGSGAVETIYGKPPRDHLPESVTRCLGGVTVVDPMTVRVTDACAGMLIQLSREVMP